MDDEHELLRLEYGAARPVELRAHPHRLLLHHRAPRSVPLERGAVADALRQPLDFPALGQALVPDDRVVIIVEPDTPGLDAIIAELWTLLDSAGVRPERVLLLQPSRWRTQSDRDPRSLLSDEFRERIRWRRHDPTLPDACGYLASTAAGDRVYLAQDLLEADAIFTVGPLEFDPLLGVRGGASSLYPGLSDVDSWRKTQGQGHDELQPDDPRPLRQAVDEIGWLLGLQFCVGVVPGASGGAHQVLAGQIDSVLRRGREVLAETSRIDSEERAELVIVTVPGGQHPATWEEVSAAFDAGRRLVERNGRIVVLSQLEESPGPGLASLREVLEPRDLLSALRTAAPPDLLVATRIAAAADWANLSLLSRLPDAALEDLFIQPVRDGREVQRLLEADPLTAIIESGQHCFVNAAI